MLGIRSFPGFAWRILNKSIRNVKKNPLKAAALALGEVPAENAVVAFVRNKVRGITSRISPLTPTVTDRDVQLSPVQPARTFQAEGIPFEHAPVETLDSLLPSDPVDTIQKSSGGLTSSAMQAHLDENNGRLEHVDELHVDELKLP